MHIFSPRRHKSSLGLDAVWLDKIGFSHPISCCRAVCHAEGAVSSGEAPIYDVDPGGDHRCKEFEQIVRCSK
jgi:hypothetical protein